MSESRKNRRANDPAIRQRAADKADLAGKVPAGNQPQGILTGVGGGIQPAYAGDVGGSGWGVGSPNPRAARGSNPIVNPFMTPKGAGLSVVSQTYPSNFYVEWTPSTWRQAGDRVMQQGWTVDLATLYVWCFTSSPFVQSLFRTIETAINSVPFFYTDQKGNVSPEWTKELCGKAWQMEMRREIAFSFFWGFAGFNFDPLAEKLYVYPTQDLDPINRFLRQSTYNLFEGEFFDQNDNMLFVQPNTTMGGYLGWMYAITRLYILMHLNDENWVQAGKRLAFPVFTLGYPESMDQVDPETKQIYNPYKAEAQMIARDIGPGKTVIFPFTRKADGEIEKNIELEFEQPGTSQKAHSIFMDFNETKKNEIRELCFGGSLTADVGDSGSRALGEIQERKLRVFMQSIIEYVITVLNGEFKKKISKYYRNMPKGSFDINRQKQFTIEEVVAWTSVLGSSGKRWSTKFFESNGIPPDFIEDAPEPAGAGEPLSKKNDGRIQELHSELAHLRTLHIHGNRW